MRKVLFMLIVAIALQQSGTFAQTILNDDGVYELKIVEEYEGVSGTTLYERSLLALSDWAGSQKKSKTNIDVQDKEAGIVVYKCEHYMGFRKVNMLCGYEVFANMTLKVRCKDNKVQYTLMVPSLTLYWSCDMTAFETIPLREIIPEYIHKGRLKKMKNSSVEYAAQIDVVMKQIQKNLVKKTKDAEKDEF